jgi:cytochrome c553
MLNSIKRVSLTLGFISLLFIGCGDKKDNNNKEVKETTINNSSSAKIEVIENHNKETKIKVVQHKNKKNEAFYYEDLKHQERDMISTRTVLDAHMHIRSPYERVRISLIRQQLGKNFKLKCSACHDDYANGIVGPSLLGKDADFIYKKILEFKTTKKNPLMTDLINQMDNKEIRTIAEEIYKFNQQVQKLGAKE